MKYLAYYLLLEALLVFIVTCSKENNERSKRQDGYFYDKPKIPFDETNTLFDTKKTTGGSRKTTVAFPQRQSESDGNKLDNQRNEYNYKIPLISLGSNTIKAEDSSVYDVSGLNVYTDKTSTPKAYTPSRGSTTQFVYQKQTTKPLSVQRQETTAFNINGLNKNLDDGRIPESPKFGTQSTFDQKLQINVENTKTITTQKPIKSTFSQIDFNFGNQITNQNQKFPEPTQTPFRKEFTDNVIKTNIYGYDKQKGFQQGSRPTELFTNKPAIFSQSSVFNQGYDNIKKSSITPSLKDTEKNGYTRPTSLSKISTTIQSYPGKIPQPTSKPLTGQRPAGYIYEKPKIPFIEKPAPSTYRPTGASNERISTYPSRTTNLPFPTSPVYKPNQIFTTQQPIYRPSQFTPTQTSNVPINIPKKPISIFTTKKPIYTEQKIDNQVTDYNPLFTSPPIVKQTIISRKPISTTTKAPIFTSTQRIRTQKYPNVPTSNFKPELSTKLPLEVTFIPKKPYYQPPKTNITKPKIPFIQPTVSYPEVTTFKPIKYPSQSTLIPSRFPSQQPTKIPGFDTSTGYIYTKPRKPFVDVASTPRPIDFTTKKSLPQKPFSVIQPSSNYPQVSTRRPITEFSTPKSPQYIVPQQPDRTYSQTTKPTSTYTYKKPILPVSKQTFFPSISVTSRITPTPPVYPSFSTQPSIFKPSQTSVSQIPFRPEGPEKQPTFLSSTKAPKTTSTQYPIYTFSTTQRPVFPSYQPSSADRTYPQAPSGYIYEKPKQTSVGKPVQPSNIPISTLRPTTKSYDRTEFSSTPKYPKYNFPQTTKPQYTINQSIQPFPALELSTQPPIQQFTKAPKISRFPSQPSKIYPQKLPSSGSPQKPVTPGTYTQTNIFSSNKNKVTVPQISSGYIYDKPKIPFNERPVKPSQVPGSFPQISKQTTPRPQITQFTPAKYPSQKFPLTPVPKYPLQQSSSSSSSPEFKPNLVYTKQPQTSVSKFVTPFSTETYKFPQSTPTQFPGNKAQTSIKPFFQFNPTSSTPRYGSYSVPSSQTTKIPNTLFTGTKEIPKFSSKPSQQFGTSGVGISRPSVFGPSTIPKVPSRKPIKTSFTKTPSEDIYEKPQIPFNERPVEQPKLPPSFPQISKQTTVKPQIYQTTSQQSKTPSQKFPTYEFPQTSKPQSPIILPVSGYKPNLQPSVQTPEIPYRQFSRPASQNKPSNYFPDIKSSEIDKTIFQNTGRPGTGQTPLQKPKIPVPQTPTDYNYEKQSTTSIFKPSSFPQTSKNQGTQPTTVNYPIYRPTLPLSSQPLNKPIYPIAQNKPSEIASNKYPQKTFSTPGPQFTDYKRIQPNFVPQFTLQSSRIPTQNVPTNKPFNTQYIQTTSIPRQQFPSEYKYDKPNAQTQKQPFKPFTQKPNVFPSYPVSSQPPINIYQKPTNSLPSNSIFVSSTQNPFEYKIASKKPVYAAPTYIPPIQTFTNKPLVPRVSSARPFTYLTTEKPVTYPKSTVKAFSFGSSTPRPFTSGITSTKLFSYKPSTYKPYIPASITQKPITSKSTTSKPFVPFSTFKPVKPVVTGYPISLSTTQKPITSTKLYYKPYVPPSLSSTKTTFVPQFTTTKLSTPSAFAQFSSVRTTPKPVIYSPSTYKPFVPFSSTVKPLTSSTSLKFGFSSTKPSIYSTPTFKPYISTTKPITYQPSLEVSSTVKPFSYTYSSTKPFAPVFTTPKPFTYSSSTYKSYIPTTTKSKTTKYVSVTDKLNVPTSTAPKKSVTYAPSTYKTFKPLSSSVKPFTYGSSTYKQYIPVITTPRPVIAASSTYKPFIPFSSTIKSPSYPSPTSKPQFTTIKPFTYSSSTNRTYITEGTTYKPRTKSTTQTPLSSAKLTFKPYIPVTTTPKPSRPSFGTYKPYVPSRPQQTELNTPKTVSKIPSFSTTSRPTSFVKLTTQPSTTQEDRHYLPPKSDGYFYPKPDVSFEFK